MMKRITWILLSILLLFNIAPTALAKEEVPYSLRTILPDSQVDQEKTYFDLAVEKNTTEKLQVEVFNNSNEPIEVKVSANTGATNSNGLLVYDGSIKEFDNSLKYNFTKMTDVLTPTLKIEPYEKEIAEFSIQMPEKDFDGTLLGGLRFLLIDDSTEDSSGVQIKNNYAYEIAVVLNDKNSNKKLQEEIEINGVNPGLINNRTGLNVEFSNKQPILMTNSKIAGAVFKKGNDTPLYERKDDNFSIAPNALFNHPISFNNEKLKKGKYVYKGTITTDNETFEFEKDFEITEETAKEANENAVEVEKTDWKTFALIIAGMVIIGLLILLIFMVMRKKK